LLLFICITITTGVNSSNLTKSFKRNLFIISGLITGLLPLIHAHSFACLALIFLPYALLHPKRSFSLDPERGLFIPWLQFGIPILLECFPQLFIYMDRLGQHTGEASSSFLNYSPLWQHHPWRRYHGGSSLDDLFNFLLLWGRGTGIFVLLSLLGFAFLDTKQKKLYFCFWLIWIIGNVIQFQPWDKDNTKLFIVWTMACAGVCAMVINKIWRAPLLLSKLLVIAILISLMLSGSMMLYRESTLWWQWMDQHDREFGEWVAVNTDPDAVFIVNDSHINPVTNLGGRTALVNMAGWVQSHGYPNMWGRYSDLRTMLSAPARSFNLFKNYDISYVVYDWHLNNKYQVDAEFFQQSPLVDMVFHSTKYTIYDVTKLR